MKITIVYKRGAKNISERAARSASDMGFEVRNLCSVGDFVDGDEDMVLVLGGDGSLLRMSHKTKKPIALLRYGSFGHFSTCDAGEHENFLSKLSGGFECYEIRKIEAEFNEERDFAVNEFFVRGDTVLKIRVRISDRKTQTLSFGGDGVIVSTAAGSTGHSSSYGGPLIFPECPVMLLLPVAPLRSNLRALVLPERCEVSIKANTRFTLISDGQRSRRTDNVVVKRSNEKLLLVKGENTMVVV